MLISDKPIYHHQLSFWYQGSGTEENTQVQIVQMWRVNTLYVTICIYLSLLQKIRSS